MLWKRVLFGIWILVTNFSSYQLPTQKVVRAIFSNEQKRRIRRRGRRNVTATDGMESD